LEEEDKSYQPKSLIIHSPDYVSNVQRQLGVINFDQAYSNFFQQAELAYKLTVQIEEAINQKIIDIEKHPELKLNKQAVYKLKKLWDGQCYLTIEHDHENEIKIIPDSERFHYDKSKIDYKNQYLEIIPIPALDNMTPVGQLKQRTLLIEITQSIPLRYAWQGLDYATVVTNGYTYNFSDKVVPKLKHEDMYSTTKLTYRISRDVYHRIIKKEKNKFIYNWTIIYHNIHKIIEYLKVGIREEGEHERHSTSIAKPPE